MKNQSRRTFLGKSLAGAGGLATAGAAGLGNAQDGIAAAEEPKAEQYVRQLLGSLSEEQRSNVVLPYSSKLRHRIENNWYILKDKRVGNQFSAEQQVLIRDIFRSLHSKQMRDEVWRQFLDDNGDKNAKTPDQIFGTASVALFQDEGSDDFEFVLTGRHTTRRCDNNSQKGVAFGGPIFYGHAPKFYESSKHEGNAYWFQAKRANELFDMLDEKQRIAALQGDSRGEMGSKTVELTGSAEGLEGVNAGDFSDDQKKKLIDVVTDLLAPFRSEDRIEAATMINEQMSDLHLAFYKNEDVGDDGMWDTWQIEGPNMVWYFRGEPHVHTWVHVKEPVAG